MALNPRYRFLGILILNVPVVVALYLLIQREVISMFAAAAMEFVFFTGVSALLVWRLYRRRMTVSEETDRSISIPWISSGLFTFAAAAAIVAFILKPNIYRASQAGIGIFLVGCYWYMIYRARRLRRDRDHSSETTGGRQNMG